MPIRRRIIKGGYVWECAWIESELVPETNARTRFPLIYEAYAAFSEERRWGPVVRHVFASVLRREVSRMAGVRAVGARWVTWEGVRLRNE